MSRLFALYLTLLIVLTTVQSGGCSHGLAERASRIPHVEADAPISDDIDEIKQDLKAVRARERLLEGALDDARLEALQTKIWVGVGLSILAGVVLLGLGIWTTRRFLVELGLGAFALAALGALAAWAAPYLIWIGAGLAVTAVGVSVWMCRNRESALTQVTDAVNSAKERIPQFRDQYRPIFREHIDSAMDRVVNSVRKDA